MAEIVFSGMAHDRNIANKVKPWGVYRYDDHAGLKVGPGLRIGNGHNDGKLSTVGR